MVLLEGVGGGGARKNGWCGHALPAQNGISPSRGGAWGAVSKLEGVLPFAQKLVVTAYL